MPSFSWNVTFSSFIKVGDVFINPPLPERLNSKPLSVSNNPQVLDPPENPWQVEGNKSAGGKYFASSSDFSIVMRINSWRDNVVCCSACKTISFGTIPSLVELWNIGSCLLRDTEAAAFAFAGAFFLTSAISDFTLEGERTENFLFVLTNWVVSETGEIETPISLSLKTFWIAHMSSLETNADWLSGCTKQGTKIESTSLSAISDLVNWLLLVHLVSTISSALELFSQCDCVKLFAEVIADGWIMGYGFALVLSSRFPSSFITPEYPSNSEGKFRGSASCNLNILNHNDAG